MSDLDFRMECSETDSSDNVKTTISPQITSSETSENTVECFQIDQSKPVRMLPLSKLKSAIEKFQEVYRRKRGKLSKRNGYCSESLFDLKLRNDPEYYRRNLNWPFYLNKALRNAVFSHNWDALLNILITNPIQDYQGGSRSHVKDNYKRAIIILLLNHPNAKNKSSLLEFLHLALSCRTEEDQKALLKVLLALPTKLPKRSSNFKNVDD